MCGYDGADRKDVWCSGNGTSWTQVTEFAPWRERHLPASVVFDGKMWLLGGYREPHHFNDVWYSTDGQNWFDLTPPPGAPMWDRRQAHAAVVHDGKMWVMGGQYAHASYLNDVWYSSGLVGIEEGQDRPALGPCGALRIMPNPVAGGVTTVRIQGFKESGNQVAEVRVFDAAGRCVIQQSGIWNLVSGFVLDLRKVPAGVYLVRLDTKGCSCAQQLVVQR